METKRKKITSILINRVLPVLLPLLIVAFLLAQVSLQDLFDLFTNVTYVWVVVGALSYFITNIFRAFRVRTLLPHQKTNLFRLLAIMIAQSMFNNILPARTGELSFIYFLHKYEKVPLDKTAVTLIVARLFDFLAVSTLFIVAALVSMQSLPLYAVNIIWLVLLVLFLISAALFSAVWMGRQSLHFVRRLLTWMRLGEKRWIAFGLEKLTQVISAYEEIHSIKRHIWVFMQSLLVWLCTFAWFYAFLRSIGVETMPASMIVGSTFAVLSKAIPFISIGGLGAHEAGWTVGFFLIGFDKTTAILSGFAVNILTMLTSVVFGAGALLWLRLTARTKAHLNVETQ